MPTDKQRDANRRNALLSTGPRSDDGKARSSRNALKHGICVSDLTLKEDEASHAEIQALVDSYFDYHQPTTPEERDALEEIATCKVRLNLIRRVENGALNLSRREVFADTTFSDPAGNSYLLFDSANWPPEEQRALANMHLAAAWARSQDLLDRVSRYEGRLYQRYRRAQDRWDTLQKARAQAHVEQALACPPPADQPPVAPALAGPPPAQKPPCDRPAGPGLEPKNTSAQNKPNFDLTPSPATPPDPASHDKETR